MPRKLPFVAALAMTALSCCPCYATAADFTSIQSSLTHQSGPAYTLSNLNAQISTEYLLQYPGGLQLHLSVAENISLQLDASGRLLAIDKTTAESKSCGEFDDPASVQLKIKQHLTVPYIGTCEGRIYIRNKTDGYQSRVEWGSTVLRSNFGDLGEWLVGKVKEVRPDTGMQAEITRNNSHESSNTSPFLTAKLNVESQNIKISKGLLGMQTLGTTDNKMVPGSWYQAKNHPSFYVSTLSPNMIDREILNTHKDRVGNFDGVEQQNLVYLVAWNTDEFNLGWSHGTLHPGVEWSRRAVNISKDNPDGPDGFARLSPFVGAGAVRPDLVSKTVATFSGGFQRAHSAFKWGELSQKNAAHHYGFVENGVVLSSLQPSLSTIYENKNGFVDLLTWQTNLVPDAELKSARQNGVPLVEGGDADSVGIPGRLVSNWGAGNWSGSVDKSLRTPRAAACIVRNGSQRYFIYAYFTSATPNAMARVFQAYSCDDAIHLDMNSAGQAYFGVFKQTGELKFDIEHLVAEMAQVDPKVNGSPTPRYLIKSDYRDFFYLTTK